MFENELEQLKISDFIVDKISCAGAMKAILASHYMHRKTPCMYAYGLYYSIEALGVISFGLPASPSLVKGICGEEEKEHVIELNRLWIRDGTPKNSESFLIGQALKMLPKKYSIVVSYADTKENHTGIVYQATNFLYTGLSANVFNYQLAGEENKHSRGFLQRLSLIHISEPTRPY